MPGVSVICSEAHGRDLERVRTELQKQIVSGLTALFTRLQRIPYLGLVKLDWSLIQLLTY